MCIQDIAHWINYILELFGGFCGNLVNDLDSDGRFLLFYFLFFLIIVIIIISF